MKCTELVLKKLSGAILIMLPAINFLAWTLDRMVSVLYLDVLA